MILESGRGWAQALGAAFVALGCTVIDSKVGQMGASGAAGEGAGSGATGGAPADSGSDSVAGGGDAETDGGAPSGDGSGGAGASSNGSGGTGATSSGGSDSGALCNSGEFLANERNNYTFSSTLTFPSVSVKPGSNLHFDWSGVTRDLLEHDLDPRADIGTFNLIHWELSEQQLARTLNEDGLLATDGQPPAVIETMNLLTEADLFDLKSVAGEDIPQEALLTYLDPVAFPPEMNTFTAILATGSLSGDGEIRMFQTFKVDPASQNTTVTLSNTSTTLTYQSNLGELEPTFVPAGSNAPRIDWSDMHTNSMGREFLPSQITSARISHYAETPAELEVRFLDLDRIALATYEAPVPVGRSVAFSELKSETGATFPGIDDTGTWLLALFCGVCRNPAPWYLTILRPCN